MSIRSVQSPGGGGWPLRVVMPAWLSSGEVAAYFDATGLSNGSFYPPNVAICNGRNGTPNVDGTTVRFDVSAGGAAGGSASSAHTHAIDHKHETFASEDESGHVHELDGSGGAQLHLDPSGGGLYLTSEEGPSFDYHSVLGLSPPDGDNATRPSIPLVGTTGAGGAHSHLVDVPELVGESGPASSEDNWPPFFTWVPLMRIA